MNERELLISHLKDLQAQLRALKARLESPGAEVVDPGRSLSESQDRHPGQPERGRERTDAILHQFPKDEEDYI